MNVVIASDHAGFLLKKHLINALPAISWIDLGTNSQEPVDYPDYAKKLCDHLLAHNLKKGILICGSGVGANIAANKIKGIRASVCHDSYSAKQGVEHDDMNILVLGARIVGESLAEELVKNFLQAQFSQEERHVRRVNKIKALE